MDDNENNDANSNNHTNAFSNIGINVTNEKGQVRMLSGRDVETNNGDPDIDAVSKVQTYLKWFKISALLIVWCVFTAFLMSYSEHVDIMKLITVPKGSEKTYPLSAPTLTHIGLSLQGPFPSEDSVDAEDKNVGSTAPPVLEVNIQRRYFNDKDTEISTKDASEVWKLELVDAEAVDTTTETKSSHYFKVDGVDEELIQQSKYTTLNLRFVHNMDDKVLPIQLSLDESPIDEKNGVIYAGVVLLGLYILIIWDIVHRTLAAIIASTLALGILAALHSRPTMATIVSWIDVETLLLLFGMMILVAILSETGVFDYLAVFAYQITGGRVWPLIFCLCFFTAILSSFLDNVTTVLLMAPVTIRLCEVMALNPVPILMCMVIYSNIGGALTPVGDPPNVIISSNKHVVQSGINFAIFTLHMLPGIVLASVATWFLMRFMYRKPSDLKYKDSPDIEGLRHEIKLWKRAAGSLSEEAVRDALNKKVNNLKNDLKKRMSDAEPAPSYTQTLTDLQAKYPIRNKPLLYKCCIALAFVIGLFFLHSVPAFKGLSLGWTALLGAILLIILADMEDIEAILARVEWSTLLFFAALFILMEALSELGLIEWIGNMTQSVILSVGEESQLMVGVLIILWVSAIASAFVDNIPLTTMMIKITISLYHNKELNLPLQPLIWALAFGACLGGNGTLIGASANVVCAGVAEQHGYKITFMGFFKIGFPIMIVTVIAATIYLLIAHVLFAWH